MAHHKHSHNIKRHQAFALFEMLIVAFAVMALMYYAIVKFQGQNKVITEQNTAKNAFILLNQVLVSVSQTGLCPNQGATTTGGTSASLAKCLSNSGHSTALDNLAKANFPINTSLVTLSKP